MKYKQKLRESTTEKENRTFLRTLILQLLRYFYCVNLSAKFKNALVFIKTKVVVVYCLLWHCDL
jgi:hypothetical protein